MRDEVGLLNNTELGYSQLQKEHNVGLQNNERVWILV